MKRSWPTPSTVELHLYGLNWDGEPSGYAENPDNWIFFLNRLHWQSEFRPLLLTVRNRD